MTGGLIHFSMDARMHFVMAAPMLTCMYLIKYRFYSAAHMCQLSPVKWSISAESQGRNISNTSGLALSQQKLCEANDPQGFRS